MDPLKLQLENTELKIEILGLRKTIAELVQTQLAVEREKIVEQIKKEAAQAVVAAADPDGPKVELDVPQEE